MSSELRRRTPEELLFEVQREERAATRRGYLKIFLGYASGVGKSFRMLDEARRRRERGQDVVIGAMQPGTSPDVEALLRNLEVIPLRALGAGPAVDVEALVRRRPAVCFIDGLAYDNPPDAKHPARWQDVEELLAAGIKVIGSVNVHYVSELREQVEAITGKRVTATVPMAFLKSADEIEIVDAPPGEPGDRQQRLSRLRELTLVLAADVVDHQLLEYLDRHGIRHHLGTHERILVCITPRANVREMMETARIIANRFHADLIASYVKQEQIAPADQAALEEKLSIARTAGASIEILEGEDPVIAILDFARSHGITQLFIGHSQRSGIGPRLWGNPVEKLIQRSRGMDVRVFPQ
jgi:two-component system, OmpR family, sensor histidine kinase KdpD